ncbi:MAG: hypothetical protein HYV60_12845 [Planctomycetia bacterium]|nr:hypothetical protein [Planctomycetia bacterium]
MVLSTESGGHAMGVYSPDQPSPGYDNAGYGRWRFVPQKVTKWNCVFRLRDPNGIAPGEYSFRNFVIVGTKDDVLKCLNQLDAEASFRVPKGRPWAKIIPAPGRHPRCRRQAALWY